MRLFKYCTPSGKLILQNRKIKFADVTRTNDPFDCMPLVDDSLSVREGLRQKIKQGRLSSLIPNEADEYGKALGLTSDQIEKLREISYAKATANFREYFTTKPGSLFMLSLAENSNNLLMWSHYADEHRGILIELETDGLFDLSSEGKKLLALELNKVKYQTRRPLLNPLNPETPEVYLSKSPFWEYEQEWRVLAIGQNLQFDAASNMHFFPLKPSSVQRVVAGCRADTSFIEDLRVVLSDRAFGHVTLQRAELSQTDYTLNYVAIS